MSDLMTEAEHEYFHQLIYILMVSSEPKFAKGATEHRVKGDLWDMSDEDLETEIQNEILDLLVYYAEKIRRSRERTP
jgi:hypothetical protein